MGATILVADDDADNRAIVTAALEAAGFRVSAACDGGQAVELALRERPALILMDLAMPMLSGWEAVRRIKAMTQTRDIPVFAFTAYALVGDEEKAREVGCEGYISKPCIPREIVEKIRRRVEGR